MKRKNSVETHIQYIKEAIDEIKDSIQLLHKKIGAQDVEIATVKAHLENHLRHHQRDLTVLGIVVSIIAVIVSVLMKVVT